MKRGLVHTLIVLCWFLVVSGCSGSGNRSQPIAYNHKLHIEEAELACPECHKGVLTRQKASIPNIEVCADCHDEAMTESKEEEKVVGYISRNEKIPWVQIHRVPDYVYFSHRRHVSMAGFACAECHGKVINKTAPFTRPGVKLTMEFCMDCHEENDVTTDCAACHR